MQLFRQAFEVRNKSRSGGPFSYGISIRHDMAVYLFVNCNTGSSALIKEFGITVRFEDRRMTNPSSQCGTERVFPRCINYQSMGRMTMIGGKLHRKLTTWFDQRHKIWD